MADVVRLQDSGLIFSNNLSYTPINRGVRFKTGTKISGAPRGRGEEKGDFCGEAKPTGGLLARPRKSRSQTENAVCWSLMQVGCATSRKITQGKGLYMIVVSLLPRSSHKINSGGARSRARGAPKPSIPNPRLT